jgi:hypothetical protein
VTTNRGQRPATTQQLDAAGRVKEGMAVARDTVVETYRESPPVVLGAAAVLVAAVVALVMWRKQ